MVDAPSYLAVFGKFVFDFSRSLNPFTTELRKLFSWKKDLSKELIHCNGLLGGRN